jgi:hypothetical protein
MKRLICLMTALLLLAAFAGCKDETEPKITRISLSQDCGVVPLSIEVYGAASGGDETGDPTGGVNNLEYQWDFGDGTGATSISYHRYTVPGDYVITLTVTDPGGKQARSETVVSAIADSLHVETTMTPDTGIDTTTPVTFGYTASSCDIDEDLDDDYVKLSPVWHVTDPAFPDGVAIYHGRTPTHTFSAPGTYDVRLQVHYAAWSVFRNVTMQVVVGS